MLHVHYFKVYKAEGIKGLYRGCVPPLWGSGIYRSVQFSAFEATYLSYLIKIIFKWNYSLFLKLYILRQKSYGWLYYPIYKWTSIACHFIGNNGRHCTIYSWNTLGICKGIKNDFELLIYLIRHNLKKCIDS